MKIESSKIRLSKRVMLVTFTLLLLMLVSIYQILKNETELTNLSRKFASILNSSIEEAIEIARTHRPELEKTSAIHKENYECKQLTWPSSENIKRIFKLNLSWLQMTEEEYLIRRHPNLPMSIYRSAINGTRCHLMPTIFSIEWVNEFWQKTRVSENTTFLLYSAIYDNRPQTDLRPCVRLVGLSNSVNPAKGFCSLWFNATGPPEISQVSRIEYVDWQAKSEDRQLTYILTCRVPPAAVHSVPEAVSLMEHPSIPANNVLRVIGAKERDPSTAFLNGQGPRDANRLLGWSVVVCGPALFYYHEDFSARLVEWLEIYKAMGFSKAIFYVTDVHPNIEKVLRYYEQKGYVDVIDFTHPPPYIDDETLRSLFVEVERSQLYAMQNVYYTDCVLRYAHKYRFLAHTDPDEYFFIKDHQNFTQFLDYLLTSSEKDKLPSQYKMRWNFHYDDVESGPMAKHLPQYLWALRHNQREKGNNNRVPVNFKTLYDLDTVTGAFAHFALVCSSGGCRDTREIPVEEAYVAHFSKTCGDYCKKTDILFEDNFLLRYTDRVHPAVKKVLTELGIL